MDSSPPDPANTNPFTSTWPVSDRVSSGWSNGAASVAYAPRRKARIQTRFGLPWWWLAARAAGKAERVPDRVKLEAA